MKATFSVVTILVVCFCVGVFPLWNHIFALSYFETDFIDYCVTLESFSLEHDPGFRRSRFGMIVVYLLSLVTDVLGAFTWNALICTFFLLVVFYQWILSIEKQKEQAAIITGLLFLSLPPIIALGRNLTYYPTTVLAFAFSAFALMKLLHKPNRNHFLLVGIAISLSLLVDPRGFFFGGYCLYVSLVVLVLHVSWYNTISMFLPLFLSWFVGWWAYCPDTYSFANQVFTPDLFRVVDTTSIQYHVGILEDRGFVWGYGSIENFIQEISLLLDQAFLAPPESFETTFPHRREYSIFYSFWFYIFVGTFTLAVYQKAWFHLIPLVPFFVVFLQQNSVLEPHIRFFSQSMVAFFILLPLTIKKFSFPKKRGILILLLFSSHYCNPKWSLERSSVNNLLSQSLKKEAKDLIQMRSGTGFGVHLKAKEILGQRESRLRKGWKQRCISILETNDSIVPFYTDMEWEKKNAR